MCFDAFASTHVGVVSIKWKFGLLPEVFVLWIVLGLVICSCRQDFRFLGTSFCSELRWFIHVEDQFLHCLVRLVNRRLFFNSVVMERSRSLNCRDVPVLA